MGTYADLTGLLRVVAMIFTSRNQIAIFLRATFFTNQDLVFFLFKNDRDILMTLDLSMLSDILKLRCKENTTHQVEEPGQGFRGLGGMLHLSHHQMTRGGVAFKLGIVAPACCLF